MFTIFIFFSHNLFYFYLLGPSPSPYSNGNVGTPPGPPPGGGGGPPGPPGPPPPGPAPGPSPTGKSICKPQVRAMDLSKSSCVNSAYDSSWAYRGSVDGDDYNDEISSDSSSGLSEAGVIALSVCLSVCFCSSVIAYFMQQSWYGASSVESKVYVAHQVQMVRVDQPQTDLGKVKTKGRSAKIPNASAYTV